MPLSNKCVLVALSLLALTSSVGWTDFPGKDDFKLEKPVSAKNIANAGECRAAKGKWFEGKDKDGWVSGCLIKGMKEGLWTDEEQMSQWFVNDKGDGCRLRSNEELASHKMKCERGDKHVVYTLTGGSIDITQLDAVTGRKDGKALTFAISDCRPLAEEEYQMGKAVGVWRYYSMADGLLAKEVVHTENGSLETLYREGVLYEKSEYDSSGERNGIYQLWTKKGVLWFDGMYKNGELHAPQVDECRKKGGNFYADGADAQFLTCEADFVLTRSKYNDFGIVYRIEKESLNDDSPTYSFEQFSGKDGKTLLVKGHMAKDDNFPMGKYTYYHTGKPYDVDFGLNKQDVTGEYIDFHANNDKMAEKVTLNKGCAEGFYNSYNEDEKLIQESEYHDCQLNGTMRFFFATGALRAEIEYKNNVKHGKEYMYYDNGSLMKKSMNCDGSLCSDAEIYNYEKQLIWKIPPQSSGNPAEGFDNLGRLRGKGEVHVRDSVVTKVGKWKLYFSNGTPWRETTYAFGVENNRFAKICSEQGGTFVSDHDQRYIGCKKCRINLSRPREPIWYNAGPWRWWHANGRIEQSGYFKDDLKTGEWTQFFDSGSVLTHGFYTKGLPSGRWRSYYRNQNKRFSGAYDDAGREIGTWTSYHENGNKSEAGEYREGKRIGMWSRYFDDGKVREYGNYEDGKEEGVWQTNYPSGAKKGEGAFRGGKRDGKWTWFREDGTPWRTAYYSDDKEVSESAYLKARK